MAGTAREGLKLAGTRPGKENDNKETRAMPRGLWSLVGRGLSASASSHEVGGRRWDFHAYRDGCKPYVLRAAARLMSRELTGVARGAGDSRSRTVDWLRPT